MANKKISELPYISNVDIQTTDLLPLVTYFSSVTGDTVHTLISDLQSVLLGATPVSYSSFNTLITNSGLTQGSFYLINDFQTCYDQPDFDWAENPITVGNYRQGPVEPILVLATSNSTISEDAYQPTYPKDKIKYDWTYTTTEVTGNVAYGRITERIDELNNRTDYDHRNILFKRYKLYDYTPNKPLNGTIEILLTGTVNGTDTNFTSLSVGDVIYVPASSPSYFEIVNITDDITMDVSGDTVSFVPSGNQFYLSTEQTNFTNDYFSFKQTNVKSNDYLEYNTFVNFSSNEIKDNYIGNYFDNYTNIGAGVFSLSNNVFFGYTCKSNKIGNYSYSNTFGSVFLNNDISDFCQQNVCLSLLNSNVIGQYFENNLITINFEYNSIGLGFGYNKFYPKNKINNNFIGNGFSNNIIFNTFKSNNILNEFTDNTIGDYGNDFLFDGNNIGSRFNNNIIKSNFVTNVIGESFSKNIINGRFGYNKIDYDFFANEVGSFFNNNTLKNNFEKNIINDDFEYNDIGSLFNANFISFQFQKNIISYNFRSNRYENDNLFTFSDLSTVSFRKYGNFYDALGEAIGKNVVGKELVMKVTSVSRYFKVVFKQWTQGGGGGFQYERTEIDSSGGIIGSTVLFTKSNGGSEVDVIIPGVLEITRANGGGAIYNAATEPSYTFPVSPLDTEWNSIYTETTNGSYFQYNTIGSDFINNTIGNNFGTDGTDSFGNTIGDFFNANTIGSNFWSNIIGNVFNKNIIYNTFLYNEIKNYFGENTIGVNFNSNNVGNFFQNNVIGGYFENNQIGDYFGTSDGSTEFPNYVGAEFTITYQSLQGIPTGITLTNGGTSYSDSTNVPTTGGLGSSLTVDIVTDGTGIITGVTINNPGTYYSAGNVITITTGGNDATLTIDGVSSFSNGDLIDNGFGVSAEIVTDNGVSAATVNVILGGVFSNGDTIDNGVGVLSQVVDFSVAPAFSGGTQNNVIGNYFFNNQIGYEFKNNKIGNYFGNDMSTGMSNIILDNFQSNIISNYFGIDVETPANGDGGNIIRNNFIGNTIGDSFIYNITVDTSGGGYNNNTIGWGCNNNIISDGFNYNRIGDLFQENLINSYFGGNEIGYFFNLNVIGANAGYNKIGGFSWVNEIGANFESNDTGDSFFGNIIGDNFIHNKIGNYFGQFFLTGNTFGNNIYDNVFGDHTYENIVGDNFNNNNIFNNFIGNTVGNDFQYNITQYDVNTVDFTANPATHVYNNYNCTIFSNANPTLRLSYFDALDNLIITNPDL